MLFRFPHAPSIDRRDARALLLLAALIVVFYLPAWCAWADGDWAFGDDAPGLFAPWREFAGQEMRAGRWPLWNPWVFGGLPLALNGQAALGYPFNVGFWVLPFKTALLLDAVFHSFVLGAGGYFLGRALGLSRAASWLLALCLSANGGVAGHVYAGHVTWHAARAWTPWLLWSLARGLQTRQLRFAFALSLFFFFQFSAGYPPLALVGAGFCVFAGIVWLARSLLERDNVPQLEGASRAGPKYLWLARWVGVAACLSLTLCVGLAAGLREVSAQSVHGSGLPWEHASELSGTWKSLARLVAPNVFNGAQSGQWSMDFGAHEEGAAIGMLPLLLAVGAPLWAWNGATRRERTFLVALFAEACVCVVLSLGANTPLYRWLFDNVGLFRVLRFPVRWLEVWAMLASILSALCFDVLARGKYLPVPRRQQVLAVLAGAAVFVGAAVLVSAFALAQSMEAGPLRRVALAECAWAAVLCAACAAIFLGVRRARSQQARAMWWKAALALVALDLGALFVRSERVWAEPGGAGGELSRYPAAFAAKFRAGERWATWVDWRGINGGMARRVEIFNGYDAMNTSAFWSLARAVEGRPVWVDMYQPTKARPALRIAGVTHLITQDFMRAPIPTVARLEGSHGSWQLWRLWPAGDVWPRLFLSSRVAFASPNGDSEIAALEKMARVPRPNANQDWPLLLNAEARGNASPRETVESSGRVLSWKARPNVLQCEVDAKRACWLGISQAWSPSWRAWVNGVPVRLERANGPFSALRLPAGRSRVALVYAPQSWRWGSFVGLCGLAILAGGAAAFGASRSKYLPTEAKKNSTRS
jgi:hypothetical protein